MRSTRRTRRWNGPSNRSPPTCSRATTPESLAATPRNELAREISKLVADALTGEDIMLDLIAQRQLVTGLLVEIMSFKPPPGAPRPANGHARAILEPCGARVANKPANGVRAAPPGSTGARSNIEAAKQSVMPLLLAKIDLAAAAKLPRLELAQQIGDLVSDILVEEKLQLNRLEQRDLVTALLNDMLGLGPLEPLLADESVTDILVNGAKQVFVERAGKLELTDVNFRDDAHVMHVATRIVTRVGRRIDDSTPLVDARLEDGSRVNVIAPPLAIDGPSISIRKFSKKSITLDVMVRQDNLSAPFADLLKVAARARVNIPDFGRHGLGQDDVAQRALANDRAVGTDRHHRGRGRAATAATPCGAPRNPTAQPRGPGRNQSADAGEERAPDAPRPDHPGRGARRRGARHAPGHEHGP